jgi:hypothetical protein
LAKFVDAIDEFSPLFSVIPDEHEKFKKDNAAWFESFLRMFVFAEARNFDKRASVIQNFHPLALQIDITTGTENGVLVVRTPKACEQLLEGILLNDVEFRITSDAFCTALVETISQSRFRVVTNHRVLTAAFWNFFSPAGMERHPGGEVD